MYYYLIEETISPSEAAMVTAKVTSKGQVTLPKTIREKLSVHPGESIGFEEKNGNLVITKMVEESPFDRWVGKLGHLKGRRSDDILREARGNDDRD